jgi:hypothetical protein
MGLYCLLNLIFSGTSASFQFVVLLIREVDLIAGPGRLLLCLALRAVKNPGAWGSVADMLPVELSNLGFGHYVSDDGKASRTDGVE